MAKTVAPLQEAGCIDCIMDLNLTDNYLVVVEDYERYGGGDVTVLRGNGESVIEFLKEQYNFEEWSEDEESTSIEDFLEWVNDINGDGCAYTQIFEL